MAKYLHELTQSGATSSLMPAYGFERSTVFGTSSAHTHNFTGSVYISGTLYANEYRVQVIDTSAGSTIFGNDSSDIHQFTGSTYTYGDISIWGTGKDLRLKNSAGTKTGISLTTNTDTRGAISIYNNTTDSNDPYALFTTTTSFIKSGSFVIGKDSTSAKFEVSGSTILGNGTGDQHQFTGSVYATSLSASSLSGGDITIAGPSIFGDSVGDQHQFTGSVSTFGLLSAFGVGNPSTISANLTIPANYNFVMWGPITIASGYTLTVDSGAKLKIKDISDA